MYTYIYTYMCMYMYIYAYFCIMYIDARYTYTSIIPHTHKSEDS